MTMPKKYVDDDLGDRLRRVEAILAREACDTCRSWHYDRLVSNRHDGTIQEYRPDVCPSCGRRSLADETISVGNIDISAI
jgi:hypothetical protein